MRGQEHIKKVLEREIRQILELAHMDQRLGELVSLVESRLLDIDQGEVLRSSRYERDLETIVRRLLEK